MQILIDIDSSIPHHVQITERIKIALLFGELAAGDALPSIRELEQETGVGRAIIHKAYLELEECGIIEMRHGKRATVSQYLQGHPSFETMQKVDRLIKQTLSQAKKLDISSASFAKLLTQQAREEERRRVCYIYTDVSNTLTSFIASEISRMWGVTVQPVRIDTLPDFLQHISYRECVVMTNYYRLDGVRGIEKQADFRPRIKVVPIGIRFSEEMIEQLQALPNKSKVLLVSEDQEYERHGQASLAAAYKEVFGKSELEFIVKPIRNIPNIVELAKSSKYSLIVVNTSIWEHLPAAQQKLRNLTHPRFMVDRRSLEAARMAAGIIA
jgi:GntR family transcriptional regulator